ncbi:ABC transporter permease [Acrocarpospora catenulata]|uniref:ABC transporter permease n=1 Tax=Acrocarpospora catenulata TaxID=2836182 RepID=UPI001BDADB99|nr:ABC transporter permease [Acrocarpospora catenulata]
MTAPLDVSGQEQQATPEAVLTGAGGAKAIQGRSLGQIAWMRLKRDKIALGGAGVIIFLIVVAIFAPLIVGWFGHPPNEFHEELIDTMTMTPKGGSGISAEFLFGVEPLNGRDLFSRVVYGARISLLIAFFATLISVTIGTVMGVIAGYFGGWADAIISRLMDIFLAFPILIFSLALVGVLGQFETQLAIKGDTLRILLLIFVIGFFSWGYIARIIRGQTLSLREREFVDAARSLGARAPYILFKEILPNLIAPILIYATLLIPTNVLFEAALSFLGVGIQPPTATWGGMLSAAVKYYTVPHFMFFPGMAIFITVLAFNLFGDGLRDALDPKSSR